MPNIDQVQLPDGSQYNLKDNVSNYVTAGYVDDAIDALTKADVGLGNVDNTSDLNKPVSTAQQTALNGKTDTTVIAPTEATTTASRRYEIGEQFILNGVLYTATAVIASGDSIIVNTNCDLSESITGQIKEVNAKFDRGSVSITADGTKTLGQMLDTLYALVDQSKVGSKSYIEYNSYTYRIVVKGPTQLIFSRTFASGSELYIGTYVLKSANSASINWTLKTSGNVLSSDTTSVQLSGLVMKLNY